jgi:ABC-2 type transport system permease protein
VEGGIIPLLAHYGVGVGEGLVLDRQNEPFPLPVSREIGGGFVQEIQQIDYPFFVDVRPDGMNQQSPITARLPAVTMNWVSPVTVQPEVAADRRVAALLESSHLSWLYTGTDIQPDFGLFPHSGFAMDEHLRKYPLAVTIQGGFDSFFSEESDPRRFRDEGRESQPAPAGGSESPYLPLIKHSAGSARLVVVGSAEFINDAVIGISQAVGSDRYLNNLEFLQNIIDWAVEDEELLSIRSRGSHARLLSPLSNREEAFWEMFNYGLALAALLAVSLAGRRRRRWERPLELEKVK